MSLKYPLERGPPPSTVPRRIGEQHVAGAVYRDAPPFIPTRSAKAPAPQVLTWASSLTCKDVAVAALERTAAKSAPWKDPVRSTSPALSTACTSRASLRSTEASAPQVLS